MHQSGGKIKAILRKISPYFCTIQLFQILVRTFENLLNKALECLDFPNVLNAKLAEFIKQQIHGESNHLTSAKKTKKGRRKLISCLELFQQIQFVSFFICITCRKIQGPLFTYGCTSQGVKLFYSKYLIEVVKLKCFKIKREVPKYFKKDTSKYLDAQILQIQ